VSQLEGGGGSGRSRQQQPVANGRERDANGTDTHHAKKGKGWRPTWDMARGPVWAG
jgi:hypothetical protein